MAKGFAMAMGLWINPDFSEVEAGRAQPPRVDHDKVDFEKLRVLLEETFIYGPPVEFLVPNDTVDQVTAQMRMGQFPGVRQAPTEDLCACRDFGATMLKLRSKSSNGLINVRTTWQPLHVPPVRDRTFAPPPSLIPFVVVAADFEDAMLWQENTLPVFGLKPFEFLKALEGPIEREAGTMPKSFTDGLKDIFGCPFLGFPSILDRMSTDKMPDWVTKAM